MTQPQAITAGADSALWFTDYAATRSGASPPRAPSPNTRLRRRTASPSRLRRGRTAHCGSSRTTPTRSGGSPRRGSLPTNTPSRPAAIPKALRRDRTASCGSPLFSDKIGKITTAGVFTEYSVTTGSGPRGITAGPDGALWFTEHSANKIGRITTSGILTNEYTIPNGNASSPTDIAAGPDGALWFVEQRRQQYRPDHHRWRFQPKRHHNYPATPSGIAVAGSCALV